MRQLTYCIASSIDGFITAPHGGDPTGPEGFWPIPADYIEHLVAHYPEILPVVAREALGITAEGTRFDTALEGRKSFQIGLDAGVPDAYPHLRHLVFSRTLKQTPGSAVEIVAGDPVSRVRELKREDGKGIWLVGGSELAGALYSEIDELLIKLAPLTLGSGMPLFSPRTPFAPAHFTLTDSVVLGSGSLFLTYRRRRDGEQES
ncbi:dihydrofolate reductase family protein [Streptomyces uncialis]|uniref:dihydrofolate reductase family protein n=1 Tax=Streptomyces uncialis TaxID=1048205 RepID=UPI00386BD349|nr:dihydrofolate reductase family protein [Streptomyces uncialis]